MFVKYLRDIIVEQLGSFIEDVSEENINIDKWNGVISIENAVLKSDALEPVLREIEVQAPITLKRGVIKKIDVIVPWAELLSKPF